MENPISLNQIGLYNPQRQSAEVTEKLFVVRQKQFESLLSRILEEKADSIPQHYLIIGQRGMGKTTFLKRFEVEFHKEEYRERFVPLLFREEQYNVRDLGEFWLNSLDALADSLESEKYPQEILTKIDQTIKELSKKKQDIVAEDAYLFLMATCRELHRRPVLLIDNIGLVFSRLDSNAKNKPEQYMLRKLLSENGAPIVISAGVTVTDDVTHYGMPFYDFFQIQYLRKLNYEEFVVLLKNLAMVTGSDESVLASIRRNTSRQRSLLELTGGSPRTTVMLFKHIVKGFSSDINDDLEALADEITPLYKARFEDLPTQQQLVLDAIAMNWDAISMRKLTSATRMKNTQLSPQLKRLIDEGWIETTPAYKAKGNAYFISERFFNVWYLIRNSTRRHKEKIYCLSKFLECFYGKEELERLSDSLLEQDICSPNQMLISMALSSAKVLSRSLRKKIEDKNYEAFMANELLRKEFDFPQEQFLLEKGLILLELGKYEEALGYFDQILESNPDSVNAWFYKGSVLKQLGRYEDSLAWFDKCIEKGLDVDWVWMQKGQLLQGLERYDEAIDCFDRTLEINPGFELARNSKIDTLILLQRYHEVLFLLEKEIESGKKDAGLFCNMGICLVYLNRQEESLIYFDKAIDMDDKNSFYWEFRGMVLFALKRNEESLDCYNLAIDLNPQVDIFWVSKAQVLRVLERPEEAENCYSQALELNPENEKALWGKGLHLFQMRDYEQALKYADRLIKISPVNEEVYVNRGRCLMFLGDYEEAINTYKKAVSINPENLTAIFDLVFLYRDVLGRTDEAKSLFNTLDELKIMQNEEVDEICRYYLNKSLFALYDENRGLSKDYLLQAFGVLQKEDQLSVVAYEHWWMWYGSTVVNLGQCEWLLDILEDKGYDTILSPYYTAIKALCIEKKDGKEEAEVYLKNQAVEISDPARLIIEDMRRWINKLDVRAKSQ